MVNKNHRLDKLEAYLKNVSGYADIKIPKNVLEFIREFLPEIQRRPRTFDVAPFWEPILLDNHSNIMVTTGRQVWKTSCATALIAHNMLLHPATEHLYILDSDAHRLAFSENRLRNEIFVNNPRLAPMLALGRANLTRIRATNGSTIFCYTHTGGYTQAEGRTAQTIFIDEAQNQDLQFIYKALYTQTQVDNPRFYAFSIGGEMSSELHNNWERSDQREWFYDDKFWRDKLTFDSQGHITNNPTELRSILSGNWVPQKPENHLYRGYWIPQTIFPTIPLTIEDAVNKYNKPPYLSIEYQRLHFPRETYETHTMGRFIASSKYPVLAEDVRNCFVEYIEFMTPADVEELRHENPQKISVYCGIDWGSGIKSSSQTVLTTILHWHKSNRIQIIDIDARPLESLYDQVVILLQKIQDYKADNTVADIGYGAVQCQMLRDGFEHHGTQYKGLSGGKFTACMSMGSVVDPDQEHHQETDDVSKKLQHLNVNKTVMVDSIISILKQTVPHPRYRADESLFKPVLMIPHKVPHQTDMLVKDFTSIRRKDIDDEKDRDTRIFAKKEYNHIPDAIASLCYSIIAKENRGVGDRGIFPVKRRR